jgi:hypothetical protein
MPASRTVSGMHGKVATIAPSRSSSAKPLPLTSVPTKTNLSIAGAYAALYV